MTRCEASTPTGLARRLATCAVALAFLLCAAPAHAVTASEICRAAKLKAAGKKAACVAKAAAADVLGRPSNAGKCGAKLNDAFAKAEAKGGCPSTGDAVAVGSRIDAETNLIEAEVASGPHLTDNGDGTITDSLTGLQWEKKNGAGGGADLANPHDVDNTYTWSAACLACPLTPDGTAFTDLLVKLNNRCRNDVTIDCTTNGDADCSGVGGPCGFAGHRDWRLPTSGGAIDYSTRQAPELESIVDLSASGCNSGSPCIDPIFGPTAASVYWSSSSDSLNGAWDVNFGNGSVSDDYAYSNSPNSHSYPVRAVRGGP